MLALAGPFGTPPPRAHRQHAREPIERPFVRNESAVVRLPPVTAEETRHHAVAAAAVPHQYSAGLQHARKFPDDARVVRRVVEEAERREEIEHAVEAPAPSRRELPHVAAHVAEPRARAPRPGDLQQVRREVESIDVEARFRQQVRVSALTTRNVEDARRSGQLQDVQQTRDFPPVAPEGEERFVFEQILGIEVRCPPVGLRGGQKKTGSR